MITLRKLHGLPENTRLRKIARLLDGFVHYQSLPDPAYLQGLLWLIRDAAPEIGSADDFPDTANGDPEITFRRIDKLRYELRTRLGVATGDWDLLPPAGFGPRLVPDVDPVAGIPLTGARVISVYMESIRSPFNAGSIIRSAAALGASRIGMSPDCPPIDHPRLVRSARGAERTVKVLRLPISELSADWLPLVALEVGGTPLDGYLFPEAGTLLVGSEELGLSGEALDAASHRISVRMAGVKGSLNVGVACGIALHAWCARANDD